MEESPYILQRAAPFPLKLPLPVEDVNPHLTRGSLGQPESSTQTAIDRFSRFSQLTAERPYTL